MASPTETANENVCGKNEALNVLGSNKCTEHGECDGVRTCSGAGWCQGVSGCDIVTPEVVIETPKEEVVEVVEIEQEVIEEKIEEKIEEVIEPATVVEDLFSIAEKEAMQALADMGRIFDDEDEARMI